jgi:hypothetical protein
MTRVLLAKLHVRCDKLAGDSGGNDVHTVACTCSCYMLHATAGTSIML